MLAHYEARLADVLSTRLPAPLAGRAFVMPGPGDGQPAVLVAVRHADVVAEDFGSKRPETVPGDDDRRRVVRMRCQVGVEIGPAGIGRADRIAAMDAALYALDAPDLRDASALTAPGDPGFALSSLRVRAVSVEPEDPTHAPWIELDAEGWFWPPDAPGEDGGPIVAAVVRIAGLPLTLVPSSVRLRAGGGAQEWEIRVDAQALRIAQDAVGDGESGRLALRVLDAGDRPGAGTLIGGDAGPQASRTVAAADGVIRISYRPPAAAVVERLVVDLVRVVPGGVSELGLRLGEFRIEVQG